MPVPSGKRLQFANWKMAIEIVDLPSNKMVDLSIAMWLFTRGYPDFEASSYWGVHKGDYCSGIWQAERSHHGTLGHPLGSVWSVLGHNDGSPEGRSESVKTWRVVLA